MSIYGILGERLECSDGKVHSSDDGTVNGHQIEQRRQIAHRPLLQIGLNIF